MPAHANRMSSHVGDPEAYVIAEILDVIDRRLPGLPPGPVAASLRKYAPAFEAALERRADERGTHLPPGGVVLSRVERDVLRLIALSDLDEPGYFTPYKTWPDPDVEGWQQTRARLELVFALLDDVGWARGDEREEFPLTVDPERLAAWVRARREEREEWIRSDHDETSECHEFDECHEELWRELRVLEALGLAHSLRKDDE
jgi:hypothetical protein